MKNQNSPKKRIHTNPRVKGTSPTSQTGLSISTSSEIAPSPAAPDFDDNTQYAHDFENDDNPLQAEEHFVYVNGMDLKVTKKGRAVRISDKGKDNFLIDVTDRVEPNQSTASPRTVHELYPDFENPKFNNIKRWQ